MTPHAARSLVCLLGFAASPAIVLAEGATLIYGNVSGWTVHTDPNQSYRCFAEALYQEGSSMRIGFNENSDLYLSITDPSWVGTVAGREYVLELQFDEEDSQSYRARGGDQPGTLTFVISSDARPAFLRDFQVRWSITAAHGTREPVMLSLGGSFNASVMLEDCQSSMAAVNARS